MNSEVSTHTIKVRTPAETIAPFQVALQRTTDRVQLGLSAKFSELDTALPGTVLQLAPAKNLALPFDERCKDFQSWVLATGLREIAEAFHLFLDDIHSTCRWYELASICPISDEEINELVTNPCQEFHGKNFPTKLKTLRKTFGFEFDDNALERTRSLNRVRNCYAHRRGIVREDDTHDNDALVVKWLGLRCEIGGKQYTLEQKQQLTFSPQDKMDVIFCPVERRFGVGDTLSFSAHEFLEFGVTYLFLAQSVIPRLDTLAKKFFKDKN